MPLEDAPDRSARLRLALHIGRQLAKDAPAEAPRAITADVVARCAAPPVLAVGVISAPRNHERRQRMRDMRDLLLAESPCAATMTFVLGHRSMLNAEERLIVAAESAQHGDLALLDAHDGSKPGVSHGGRAVAEKALAWLIHSVAASRAAFVCKLDDDTMPHLPNLVADLRALQSEVPNPSFAYYGVHVYRMWDWASAEAGGEPNAACGGHGDDGPPQQSSTLKRLYRLSRRGERCERAAGPFPFPDGSLEIVGRGALEAVFNSSRVRSYAARHFRNEQPPFWSHEDACLGALLHREASERELPVSYLALRRWEHNLFWVNWADRTSLVSGNTLWAHYTRSAERADYVSSAFRATAGEARDPFRCGGCGAGWGWSPPHARISCCDKPPPPQRLPPPRRFTDAGPASCGLGGGGAALQLAFWSEYGDVDPRYALRREINAHGGAERRRRAGVEACFVLGMRRRHDPTSPFNVRAWLYFEAGRHGDVDLSPLEAGRGLWPTRGHAAIEWWRRAAEHAAGEQPARFYAFGAVGRLLSLPPPELARLMKPLLEGGDPPPETLQLRQNASSPRHSQGRGLIALPAARIAKSAAAGPAGHAVGRPHHPHHLCCGSSSRLALLLGRMLA